MSQAAPVCLQTLSSGKEKEGGQQKSQQVAHKNSVTHGLSCSVFRTQLDMKESRHYSNREGVRSCIITLQAFTEESARDGSIQKQRPMCRN